MAQNSKTINVGRDTWVNQAKPDTNYNGTSYLSLKNKDGQNRYAYIYFPINVPPNVTITSARLRLHMRDSIGVGTTLTARRINEDWKGGSMTWKNRPAVTGTGASATKSPTGPHHAWWIDVTSHVQLVVGGAKWFGWRIEISDGGDNVKDLNSALADANQPRLDIEWAEEPYPPNDLWPAGAQWTATNSPVLTWEFVDNRGNTAMGGAEVHVAADPGFTNLRHASGLWHSSTPYYDLSAVGWNAPIDDSMVYWRVRVFDQAGNWSGWSDTATWRYDAMGVLTMYGPPSGVVNDPCPTVSWHLDLKDQSQWRVMVRDEQGDLVYDSGRFTNNLEAWEIPSMWKGKPVISEKNKPYTIILRVWDDVDRATTFGNERVYEAQSVVTYTPGNLGEFPTKPVVIDQTAVNGEPGTRIRWNRSTVPDRFDIWRDGFKIDSISPADANMGAYWEYVDYTARAGRTYSYAVSASENDNSTESQATSISKTDDFVGIWLVDPQRDIKIQIFGDDPGDWKMGEISTTYTPLGGTASRVVTQSLRGYEGSISGLLLPKPNRTMEQQEADMFALKAPPGRQYILVLADLAMPVVLANINVAPTPHKDEVKEVSFDFYQQGTLPFRGAL